MLAKATKPKQQFYQAQEFQTFTTVVAVGAAFFTGGASLVALAAMNAGTGALTGLAQGGIQGALVGAVGGAINGYVQGVSQGTASANLSYSTENGFGASASIGIGNFANVGVSYSQKQGFGATAGFKAGSFNAGLSYSESAGVSANVGFENKSGLGLNVSYNKNDGFGAGLTYTNKLNKDGTESVKFGLNYSQNQGFGASTSYTNKINDNLSSTTGLNFSQKSGLGITQSLSYTNKNSGFDKYGIDQSGFDKSALNLSYSEKDKFSASLDIKGANAFNYSTQNGFSSNLNYTMDKQLADRKAKQDASFEKEQAEKEEAEQKAKEAQKEQGSNVIEGVAIAVSEEENKIRQQTYEKSNETGLPDLPLKEGLETAENQSMRKDLPELEVIASHFEKEIAKAWDDSNPDGKQDHPLNGEKSEHGFWILEDNKAGFLSKIDFPREGAKKDEMTPGNKPQVKGKSVIAWFHTHPNKMSEGDGYEPWASKNDQKFSEKHNVRGIVKSHNGMYYFGPE